MSRLTLRLPRTLHEQIRELAENENISINQYVVYALTRQVTQAYQVRQVPERELREQRASYAALLETLGQASHETIRSVLDEREQVEPEAGLDAETLEKFKRQAGK